MKSLNKMALIATLVICCCAKTDVKQFIKPQMPTVNLDEIADGSYAAAFSVKDFNWRGSNLMLTLFSEDIYDGNQIDNIQVDDTLLFRGDTLIVKSKKMELSFVEINGGIEHDGADLQKTNDGDYGGMQLDDHSTYSVLGKTEILLSNDFTIIDCGDEPQEPYDTIRSSQKQYLEGVKEYKKDFMELNTVVTVKNGYITNITRRWIP